MFVELYAPKVQRQDDDERNRRKDSEGKDTIELSDSGREDEQKEEEEEDGEEGEVTEEENEGKSSEFSSGDKTDDQEYDPEVDSNNSESPASVAKSPQNRTRKSTSSNYQTANLQNEHTSRKINFYDKLIFCLYVPMFCFVAFYLDL